MERAARNRLDGRVTIALAGHREGYHAAMRTFLTIVVALGLILNSGSGFVAASQARTFAGATAGSDTPGGSLNHKAHAHGKAAAGCHDNPSKSSAPKCKCGDKNLKCTQNACACLKCFSVLADVKPVHLTGPALLALHQPDKFVKPPGRPRAPPAPPPQS
jgi:hypothetical protein